MPAAPAAAKRSMNSVPMAVTSDGTGAPDAGHQLARRRARPLR